MRYVFIPFLLLSCQPKPPTAALADADYFPLIPGQYRIYAVTEQRFLPGQPSIGRQYFRREQTGNFYTDLTGTVSYPIYYSHRTDLTQNWQVDSVGTAQLTLAEARLTTGSTTVVKLSFPIFEGQRWDGNRYNALGPDEFQTQRCHQPFRTETRAFTRTCTISQQADSTLVSKDKRLEVYAWQIGLIYAERQQLRYCAASPGCGTPSTITQGIRQFIRLVEYGND